MSSSSGAMTSTTGSSTAGRGTAGGRGRLGHRLSGAVIALGCVLFLGAAVWAAVVYRPYTVPTNSMVPTVQPGDRLLAQKVSGSDVHRGDVVVFKDKLWGSEPLVKRVVGVGGDTVSCCDAKGRLMVNGKAIDETYLKDGGPASLEPFRTRVPAGEIFLLGDNRAVSEDSRIHLADAEGGSVPVSDVRARVDGVAWPASRMGLLSPTSAFDAVPGSGSPGQGPLGPLTIAVIAGAVLILGGAAYDPVARLFRRR
ncbi:signal peptidase I [Actinacidiphila bryophytorum]|uniref:Signal peptidase I n=1 Tax=Actinacidiphila bryophytorum TaxID=1436133 RepID=A0A9W4E0L4_9ACTN|nr:signal peptidase I [Actinacidiphila bryophytorum]CAG7609499.1 Signal peptidase I [Actinacidiphila bryophytorum]